MSGESEYENGIDQLLAAAKRIEQGDMRKNCRHKKLIVCVQGKLLDLCILEKKDKKTVCRKNSVTFNWVFRKMSDKET